MGGGGAVTEAESDRLTDAQTAAEAALILNGYELSSLDALRYFADLLILLTALSKLKALGKTAADIKELKIRTQEAAVRPCSVLKSF